MMSRRFSVFAAAALLAAPLIAAECFKVRTKAPHNPEAQFWCNVPCKGVVRILTNGKVQPQGGFCRFLPKNKRE